MIRFFMRHKNSVKMIVIALAVLLCIADLAVLAQPMDAKLQMVFFNAVTCVVVWFVLYFMLRTQLKNPACTEKMMNAFVIFFLVVSCVFGILLLGYYLVHLPQRQIQSNPVIFFLATLLTAIRFQCKRENIAF